MHHSLIIPYAEVRLDVQREVGAPVEALPAGHAQQRVELEVLVERRVRHLVHLARRAHEVLAPPFGLRFDQADYLGLGLGYRVVHLLDC